MTLSLLQINVNITLWSTTAVCQSRPSIDGFARLDGHLGKIARLTPVFLQFCPSFCDLVHVQSVSELLSKLNHVATRLCTLNKWFLLIIFNFDGLPNQCSQEKSRESNLRAFLKTRTWILPVYARLYARLTPVFLLKKCPSFARLFSNMGPSEEFGTLLRTCGANKPWQSLYKKDSEKFMKYRNEYFLLSGNSLHCAMHTP